MQQGINFLAFRDQIYDWTLQNDENLFNQVNQLTQYIFSTEKAINESVILTKANLNENSTILNNNFNHYLRLSENKFTQNKIGESMKNNPEKSESPEQPPAETKTKMDIFKEALNLSIKNLQIKENDNEQDNVSISELSVSQAIFKNTRLPPTYGSKQFKAQKFLNLFFDEDLNEPIVSQKQIDNLSIRSSQPLSSPSQQIKNSQGSNNYLPPPPPLLNNVYLPPSLPLSELNLPPPPYNNVVNLPPPPPLHMMNLSLPPPPPLNVINLPPPPPLNMMNLNPSIPSNNMVLAPVNRRSEVYIEEQDPNKALLQSIMQSTKNNQNNAQNRGNTGIEAQEIKNNQSQVQINTTKVLTFQQQLALKLKLGKNYKAAPIANYEPSRQPSYQNNKNSFSQPMPISSTNNFKKQQEKPKQIKKPTNQLFQGNDQEQNEEQNALFGGNKKKISTYSQNQNNNNKFGINKNQADAIMKKPTFNEDMLFKKKPIFSKQSITSNTNQNEQQGQTKKQVQKPNRNTMLFNQDSDQEDDFIFKKKASLKIPNKSEAPKSPQPQIIKKQQKINLNSLVATNKSTPTKQQQSLKTKPNNKLFGADSDEDNDPFIKKNKKQPKQIKQENIQKKSVKKINSLFTNDQDQDDFSFKKKRGQKVNKKQQIKAETPKKQSEKNKNALFVNAQSDEDDDFLNKKTTKIYKKQKIVQKSQIKQNETQQSPQVQKMKKIAAMGGQPIMGMSQLNQKTEKEQTKIVQNEKISIQAVNINELNNEERNVQKSVKNQDLQIEQIKEHKLGNQELNNQLVRSQSQQNGLNLRRKKNKPKNKIQDFDKEQSQDNKKTIPITNLYQKKLIIQQTRKDNQPQNSYQEKVEQRTAKQSYGEKMSRMGIAGMGMPGMSPQLGMGPLIPKGMIITKPSEAKKMEKQALERLKNVQSEKQQRESEQRAMIQQQQQRQKYKERKRQEQQEKKLFLEDEQKKRQILRQHEQQQRQRLNYENEDKKKKQHEQQKRIEQEALKQRQLIMLRQEQMMQQQKRIRQEKQRQNAVEKSKNKFHSITPFEGKQQSSNPLNKTKNSPLDVPKMPTKPNPLGGGGLLGGPLSGASKKLTHEKGIVPPLPTFKKQTIKSNQPKKGLFDDDDQEEEKSSKKKEVLPMNLTKIGLNSDDVEKKKQNSLFNEDQNDLSLKPKSKKQAFQQKPKKKGLFDDSDEQGVGFTKKQKTPISSNNRITYQVKQQNRQNENKVEKKGLFENDSEEKDNSFLSKKPLQKQVPKQTFKHQMNMKKQQPEQKKITPLNQSKNNRKKGLFDESDDDQGIINKKKPVEKQKINKKKGLFDEEDEDVPFTKKKNQNIIKAEQVKPKTFGQNNESISNNKQKNINQFEKSSSFNVPLENKTKNNPINAKQKKKAHLFGSSQDEADNPMIESKKALRPAQNVAVRPVPVIEQRQQPKKNTYKEPQTKSQPFEEEKPAQKPQNNNRKLFDSASDDSDDAEMEKKKRMAVKKMKGLF